MLVTQMWASVFTRFSGSTAGCSSSPMGNHPASVDAVGRDGEVRFWPTRLTSMAIS